MMSLDCVLHNVREEILKARQKHAPMHSFHEGYAIILEELDELWVEIKKYPKHDLDAMRKEAYHLAAMAVAFIGELCEEDISNDQT